MEPFLGLPYYILYLLRRDYIAHALSGVKLKLNISHIGKFQVYMMDGRWSLMEISKSKELLVSAEISIHHLLNQASLISAVLGHLCTHHGWALSTCQYPNAANQLPWVYSRLMLLGPPKLELLLSSIVNEKTWPGRQEEI